jgi:hypothetical protein
MIKMINRINGTLRLTAREKRKQKRKKKKKKSQTPGANALKKKNWKTHPEFGNAALLRDIDED